MNVELILQHLFPSDDGNGWLTQDDSDGAGPYIKEWRRAEPQPTTEELAAAEPAALAAHQAARLIEYAANKATAIGVGQINPLTGSPISTESDRRLAQADAFIADRAFAAALADPATPQATRDAITAVLADRDRLLALFYTIRAEVLAGSAAVNTEAKIDNDSRWTQEQS